jgi:hypothetical protein
MRHVFFSMSLVALLGACALVQGAEVAAPVETSDGEGPLRPNARPEALNTTPAARPPAGARTVEQFDTTSADEKRAAAVAAEQKAASGEGRALGRTVASLGDPAQPGLWIRTPLVSAPATGRVVYPKNGKAVELDLLPLDGPKTAGSRMSLAALRVIEAPLTDLPEVDVFLN